MGDEREESKPGTAIRLLPREPDLSPDLLQAHPLVKPLLESLWAIAAASDSFTEEERAVVSRVMAEWVEEVSQRVWTPAELEYLEELSVEKAVHLGYLRYLQAAQPTLDEQELVDIAKTHLSEPSFRDYLREQERLDRRIREKDPNTTFHRWWDVVRGDS